AREYTFAAGAVVKARSGCVQRRNENPSGSPRGLKSGKGGGEASLIGSLAQAGRRLSPEVRGDTAKSVPRGPSPFHRSPSNPPPARQTGGTAFSRVSNWG